MPGGYCQSALHAQPVTLTTDDRVGDSLDGAYLIWDGLLCRLNLELQYFETFVEHMFRYMVQPSKADAKSDAFKAAMYNWILHVLTSRVWSGSCSHDIRRDVWSATMTACMIQPSYWSKKLAKELLLEGSEDFQDEWLPIFEASLPEAPPEGVEGETSELGPKTDPVPESQLDQGMHDAMYAYSTSPCFFIRLSLTFSATHWSFRHTHMLIGRLSHVPVGGGNGKAHGDRLQSA